MSEVSQSRALQLELLAILGTINVVEHQRKKAVFALLNEENKKVCDLVIKYFVQEELDSAHSLALWRKLLEYREDMTQTYGDRVSLHIACYHLTRDPDSLEEADLPSEMRCTRTAQALAIQELKAWWERCSESGAHLKEVMNEQLERMVYRANKNHQVLSFVMIKIHSLKKQAITSELRSAFARHLMDSCRCRDIVGHYERDSLAIIFPQTPAEGAKIAIGRVSQFFHDKFEPGNFAWRVSIATCPDNGVTPHELVLMAEDRLDNLKKSDQDQVESCEGKASAVYLSYVKWIKHPVYQILASPIKTTMALLIIFAAVAAMFKVTGDNSVQWKIELEQVMDESQVFPDWKWGRGESEGFKLDFADGYVSHSNEFILEDLENRWFSIPDTSSDRVRLQFRLWLSALGELKVAFGNLEQAVLSLRLQSKTCFVEQAGMIIYQSSFESIVDDYVDLTIECGPNDIQISVLEKEVLAFSPLVIERKPGTNIFFQMNKGYSLVSQLKLYGKKDEPQTSMQVDSLLESVVELGEMSIEEKVDALLKLDLQNKIVLENLKTITENLLDLKGNKKELFEKMYQVKGLEPYFLDHASDFMSQYYGLYLKQNFMPSWLNDFRDLSLRKVQLKYDELSDEKEELLFLLALINHSNPRKDNKWFGWAWSELLNKPEKDVEKRIKLFRQFFAEAANYVDVDQLKNKFLEFGNLASKNNLDVYMSLKSFVDQLDSSKRAELLDLEYINANPIIQLLVLQWLPNGEEKIECVERISLDIGKTNFGKVLCYEWMWHSVNGVTKMTREENVLLEQLSLQSRRPQLAQQALEILEK